jgi:hypothetical protein
MTAVLANPAYFNENRTPNMAILVNRAERDFGGCRVAGFVAGVATMANATRHRDSFFIYPP